ncbi:cyclic peptide export ABC transporter [Metabacillus malikii]|uniref:Cyclic peptide transporter n=1 Tax=Metabacillus malikii TaxID=1504265 RepID=A0ABT9ZCR5_9BACI|nr:cyclic peptide export ABC transporter [Metabacillus malikii]MDQ0229055.1 cyclic peptide transporter [Metabacillus malikii]
MNLEEFLLLDKIVGILLIVISFVSLVVIFFYLRLFRQIIKRERRFNGFHKQHVVHSVSLVCFLIIFAWSLYDLPAVLSSGSILWGDALELKLFSVLVMSMFVLISLMLSYYFVASLFQPDKHKKTIFFSIMLSMSVGFANAVILFLMNESISRVELYGAESLHHLISFFVLSVFVYIFGQRILRLILIKMTNDVVYEKRIGIIGKLLDSSYHQLEKIEKEKIYATLNNDTERIGGFVNSLVIVSTSIITVITCFAYLGFIHFYTFLLFTIMCVLFITVHQLFARSGNKIYKEVRDAQNVFFKKIDEFINGLKELFLHRGRMNGFKEDVYDVCNHYRTKRTRADHLFTNVSLLGELIIFTMMGLVVLVFPIYFSTFDSSSLRSFIFVLIFAIGPITSILNLIPDLAQMKISWDRIKEIEGRVNKLNTINIAMRESEHVDELQLVNVEFTYENENIGETFYLGPINLTLRSGEITYLTGGNGSGKTTLAKVLTGLYVPTSGKVLLNGKEIPVDQLGQYFAAIFSDYYLFENLYGIDFDEKEKEIEEYLQMFKLEHKVSVRNGRFSTTQLSTGQRKRLALMIAYLDNRPIYLLDEWAADQDPQYRAFFYENILPDLKTKGKSVIVISHDDRYFNLADQLIRLEWGKIVVDSNTVLAPN